MGTRYNRIDTWRKTESGGTWGGPFALDDGGEQHHDQPTCVAGLIEAHCFWRETVNTDLHGRTFRPTDDSTGSLFNGSTFTDSTGHNLGNPVYTDDVSASQRRIWQPVFGVNDSSVTVIEWVENNTTNDLNGNAVDQQTVSAVDPTFNGTGKITDGHVAATENEREYYAYTAPGTIDWFSRDWGDNAFTSEGKIEADAWEGVSLAQVERDNGFFIDAYQQIDREYWEIAVVTPPTSFPISPSKRHVDTNVNLRM